MLKNKAQSWERLGHICGNALNLGKCYWSGIDWTATRSGAMRMKRINEDPNTKLCLTQGTDHTTATEIERVEVDEGRQTLGIRLNPMESDKHEYQHRKKEGRALRQHTLRALLNKRRQTATRSDMRRYTPPRRKRSWTIPQVGSRPASELPSSTMAN